MRYAPREQALRFNFRNQEKSKSMPSGDSAQAGAFWTFLVLKLGFPYWLAVAMVISTMMARVYYSCHYLTDTMVGASIGVSMAYLGNLYFY